MTVFRNIKRPKAKPYATVPKIISIRIRNWTHWTLSSVYLDQSFFSYKKMKRTSLPTAAAIEREPRTKMRKMAIFSVRFCKPTERIIATDSKATDIGCQQGV